MKTKLISVTIPEGELMTAEQLIVYCARVSSPQNQSNTDTGAKLINYLIKNKHWSPFEMASMCIEITTSRAIAAQVLRHRSFSFQEFSQRYATATEFEPIELRRQGATNRQGGEEVFDPPLINYYSKYSGDMLASDAVEQYLKAGQSLYKQLIEAGVAKECARFVLPLTTQTRLYMNGTIRSWIHYLEQRLDAHAQKEHRLIAEEIYEIFKQEFPQITEAMDYFGRKDPV